MYPVSDLKRILIVDDEDDIAFVLAQMIKSKGYEVERVSDGQTALDNINESAPDLIVLDVMMPGLNGYEVCRSLKESSQLKDIPVIMLTAKAQKSDITWGEEAGADLYITKPFENQEVIAAIKKLLP